MTITATDDTSARLARLQATIEDLLKEAKRRGATAAEAVAKDAAAKVAEKAAGAEDAAKAANAGLLKAQETYNAAVSMEEEVAGKFNTEIRDYKTANPG